MMECYGWIVSTVVVKNKHYKDIEFDVISFNSVLVMIVMNRYTINFYDLMKLSCCYGVFYQGTCWGDDPPPKGEG